MGSFRGIQLVLEGSLCDKSFNGIWSKSPKRDIRILHGKRMINLVVLVGSGRVYLSSPRFIDGLFGCLRILGDTPV